MSRSSTYSPTDEPTSPLRTFDPNPPTVAAFAPASSSGYSATAKQRSTIIVHKKSPLLVATPPQITRALAHSHPFILPLNALVGLLSWTSGDPWESFLLVAAFWAVCLYGDYVVRYATPINGVVFLILGMWSRRYSPLSSTARTDETYEARLHKRTTSMSPKHKSLDEIVETIQQLTTRCNILLDPFLTMTDFLSTQRTATSATTRPALTTLFIRILLVTPLWAMLTLPPFYILTSRRIIVAVGTVILTWHSRPARVVRVVLWRSVFVRRISAFVTGLEFNTTPVDTASLLKRPTPARAHSHANFIAKTKKRRADSAGVHFTFILYENQRRWIGLGWTTSLFAYERSPWTDEHLNTAPSKEEFELPEADGNTSRWRWINGLDWQIENGVNASDLATKNGKTSNGKQKAGSANTTGDGGGWIYYDNKWNEGRLEDGWRRYTRRRKWFRDAELVEIIPSAEVSRSTTPVPSAATSSEQAGIRAEERVRRAKEYASGLSSTSARPSDELSDSVSTLVPESRTSSTASGTTSPGSDDTASTVARKQKSGWFRRTRSHTKAEGIPGDNKSTSVAKRNSSATRSVDSVAASGQTNTSSRSKDGIDHDVLDKWRDDGPGRFRMGEDVTMGLS